MPAGSEDVHELHRLVVQKLTKVFGEARAQQLLAQLMTELHLTQVGSLDELVQVAEALQRRGGFEATTGAMLGVDAAMRRINER